MAKGSRSSGSRPKEASPGKSAPPAADAANQKAPKQKGAEVRLSPDDRVDLYAVARFLPLDVRKACRLKIPFVTYFKDPVVAKASPLLAIDERLLVNWEPGLADGPTSARFAVVDYNADTGHLAPPAIWDEPLRAFTTGGKVLDKGSTEVIQFHQVSVWALVQRALEFFEDPNGLGRRIPWAFEGNRLIVVPHAGYGENAYYDRQSKSLQFYYFDSDEGTVFTCLSSDIVNHEFGHAVLDGIRPYYNESSQLETAAFHEFMGDLTAILLSLRNNTFRGIIARDTNGKMASADVLASIARQFGEATQGTPYLRSALRKDTMSAVAGLTSHHRISQVMTGAMFDVLMRLTDGYMKEPEEGSGPAKSPAQAFWNAAERMQRMAVQPLDLLPPVDVTFRDYALAVCRAQRIADPVDPRGYHDMLLEVFRGREILDDDDVESLKKEEYLYKRLDLSVFHDVDEISRSRSAAYRFLDDNREDLLIPAFRDFEIADLYDANKYYRQGARLPRQVVLEYIWREDVTLDGPEFGAFNGQSTNMLCGGTLVLDDNGNVLSWVRKPGTQPYGKPGRSDRPGSKAAVNWANAVKEGLSRREALLRTLAARVAAGQVGAAVGTEKGLLGTSMPPLTAESDGVLVQFRLSPHLHLSEEHQLGDEDDPGGRQWEISC